MKQHYIKSRGLWIVLLLLFTIVMNAQSLTLQQCYQSAQELSPVNRQKLYYSSIAELEEKNASSIDYPSLWLNGRLSYQSDVFTLPFTTPDVENPEIPREWYQLNLSLNQRIYDGGQSRASRDLAVATARVNQQQVTVELYQINQLINELFFGALIAQENERILDNLKSALINQLDEVASRVKNGVLLASNAHILKKEILTTEQLLLEIGHNKSALLSMLSRWVEKEIPQTTVLKIPTFDAIDSGTLSINRPEMTLFDLQAEQIEASRSLLTIKDHPNISAFAEGGVGRPNPYDVFDTDLSGFYIAGIKLKWRLLDWGSNKNDLKILELKSDVIASKKDDFKRKTSISMLEEHADIGKFEALIEKDKEILSLQEEIVNESYTQLKNGLITSTQYVIELSNQTRARTNTKIHELMLLKTTADLLVKSGNN
ncbi:MAG: hypothetical protein DHS20C17_26470 [Cyclobacteriaceae bacterium]|nr:MAG: hypothetical protein DHS20C17_26470 [Cyclobacteriaceae bacterium]